MSDSILQSVWFQDQFCSSAPDAMYQFDSDRKNWSTVLELAGKENLYHRCGFGANSLFDGCCVNMLKRDASVRSLHATKSKTNMLSAIGRKYCSLVSTKDLIFGKYQKLMILDKSTDSPFCIESRLKCKDGILYQFQSDTEMCNSNFTSHTLSNIAAPFTLDGIDCMASMETVEEGTSMIVWDTFVPGFLARPLPDNLAFYISALFTLLSIAGTLSVAGFYSYRYIKSKTNFMLAYMISQLAWLTWIMLDSYYVFYPFVENKSFIFFKAIQENWFAICSLSSVFVSANMQLVFMNRVSLLNQLLAAGSLLSLHVLLGGHMYVKQALNPDTREFSLIWSQLQALWIVFMYFFDLTPAVYIFLSLLKSVPNNGGILRRLATLHYYDKTVGILVLLQLGNAIWFISLTYIQYCTQLFRDDRNFFASYGLFTFSVVFHSILSCLLNYRIRHMLYLGNLLDSAKSVAAITKIPRPIRLKVDTKNIRHDNGNQTVDLLPESLRTKISDIICAKEGSFPLSPPLSANTNRVQNNSHFMSLPMHLSRRDKDHTAESTLKVPAVEGARMHAVPGLSIPYKSLSRQNTTYSMLFEHNK